MFTNTTGTLNSAFGDVAMYQNTTGSNNSAVGLSALENNTTGSNNTAVGLEALKGNTTASNSTAVGSGCLATSSTGIENTAIGRLALNAVTSGFTNVAVGYTAGNNLTVGHSNVYVGPNTRGSATSVNWEVVVGGNTYSTVTGKGDSTGFIAPGGNGAVYQGNNSSTWSTTSDRRLKKNIVDNNTGLDIINQIQVRNFEYRLPEEVTELPKTSAIERTGVQLGVIAQEIQQVSAEFVKEETTGVLSVDSDNLVWYLVNAVKELKAEFDAYKASHP
jgi:hypothetical protein